MVVDFKSVTKEDFEKFISTYPRHLEVNVSAISEPPIVSYNDFTRAPYWPDSVIASRDSNWGRCEIISDINAPVEDNGKRNTDNPLLDNNGVVLQIGDIVKVKWSTSTSKDFRFPRPGDIVEESLKNKGWWNTYRYERIDIKDIGTKYEHWSFESCHNIATGFDMVKIENPTPEIIALVQ